MGLSSKCRITFEPSLYCSYYKKNLTPLLGRVEEKKFASGAANANRQHFPPEIAKESLLTDYSQAGVRPNRDSLGVDDAHLL